MISDVRKWIFPRFFGKRAADFFRILLAENEGFLSLLELR